MIEVEKGIEKVAVAEGENWRKKCHKQSYVQVRKIVNWANKRG